MGKHGGINILHQKSWHVWRQDNRLIVERDELQHAEKQKGKQEAVEQSAFSAKIRKLRRRAEGKDDEDPVEELALAAGGASSSSAAEPAEKKKDSKQDASYKYGMVTTSNLKRAEADLDSRSKVMDKSQGKDKGKGKGKGKSKDKGKSPELVVAPLGSGPHINLFDAAEQEHIRHLEEHQKQMGYTQSNIDAGVNPNGTRSSYSKKALFSEFDEIASNVPWYARPRDAAGRDDVAVASSTGHLQESSMDERQLKERSRSRSRPRKKWTQSHGQALLQVKASRMPDVDMKLELPKKEEAATDSDNASVEILAI